MNIKSNSNRLKDGNIVAGAGYSTDSQQVPSQLCYNATVSSISGQSASLQLDTAQSFSDIQNDVRISVSLKGGVGMFSADAQASYLQSMEDKEYSMSLNYYYYAFTTAAVQLAGVELDALNDFGKSMYSNNATYPYFGIFCGDQYISAYDEGAMLLMGINIQFSSKYEKTQFDLHAEASFGDIFSASGQIQQIASQYSITGSVVMQAFQIGGDPSQLSYILNKDSNGDYYVLTCSLNAMTNCISAASGMLDYAKYNITTQFSFANNTGLTPLGTGFISYNPIYYVGLTPPPSLVTPNVTEDRLTLANDLLENQYYEQNLYSLLNGYPVAWDTTSTLYATIQNLYQTAQNNVAAIMNSANPQAGGLGCYTFPNQCDTITQNINSNLVSINGSDLNFLSPIQFVYPSVFGEYYYDGSNYAILPYPPGGNGDVFANLVSVSITNTSFSDFVNYHGGKCGGCIWTGCTTTSSTDGINYYGQYVAVQGSNCGSFNGRQFATTKIISPFYFEAYNGTNSDLEVSGEVPAQDIAHI
jgi:hypothetical protein